MKNMCSIKKFDFFSNKIGCVCVPIKTAILYQKMSPLACALEYTTSLSLYCEKKILNRVHNTMHFVNNESIWKLEKKKTEQWNRDETTCPYYVMQITWPFFASDLLCLWWFHRYDEQKTTFAWCFPKKTAAKSQHRLLREIWWHRCSIINAMFRMV